MKIYLILFTESGDRKMTPRLIETDSDVKQLERDIRDARSLNPDQEIYISYGTAQEPDPDLDPSNGVFYCPLCADYRMQYDWYGTKRCVVCTISENHFYVRKYNGGR